jgi:hypothetical protein
LRRCAITRIDPKFTKHWRWKIGETIFYNGSLRRTPDDVKPVLIGLEVVLDAAPKENPKAKGITVQQLVDLRYIP